MRSFKSNKNIHKKEDGSYYVVSDKTRRRYLGRDMDHLANSIAKLHQDGKNRLSIPMGNGPGENLKMKTTR